MGYVRASTCVWYGWLMGLVFSTGIRGYADRSTMARWLRGAYKGRINKGSGNNK